MKRFDILGVAAILTWLGIIAGFVHASSLDPSQGAPGASAQQIATSATASFSPGHSWMILTREGQEVGFVHESRTRMDEGGWLLEYEMWMQVALMGQGRLIKATTRAWINPDMTLKQFRAQATSFLGNVEAKGEVKDKTLHIDLTLAGKPQRITLPLEKPAKLSQSALIDLTASPKELVPGRAYTSEYFDPVQAKIVPLTYTFIEQKQTSSYETLYDTFHFRQQMLGQEMDVYVTPGGTIVIQEFPMRTVGALIPAELAKVRTEKIKKALRRAESSAKPFELSLPETTQPWAKGLQGALQSLGDFLPPPTKTPPKDPSP